MVQVYAAARSLREREVARKRCAGERGAAREHVAPGDVGRLSGTVLSHDRFLPLVLTVGTFLRRVG
jgi:hypothetical protein